MESSPIATIDQWRSPVLLVQADDDRFVPHQTTELIEDLRSRNVDYEVIMIPNEIQVMARCSSWMMLFNAADVYFDRHLDKRSVRREVDAAGFQFDVESSILANPADPRTAEVFDQTIRGHTDQFLLKVRKPT